MTAHQLAEKLLAGPDYAVVIRGYEGGVNEVDFISEAKVHPNYYEGYSYYGKHYIIDENYVDADDAERFGVEPVIHLGGSNTRKS